MNMTETTYAPADAFAAANEAAQHVREFGERANQTGRAFGQLAFDAYEKAVASVVEFENKAAEAAPVDWVKTAVGAHAALLQDVNAAYVKAARVVLD